MACVQLIVVALFKEGVGNHGTLGDGVKGFETALGIVIAIDDGSGVAGYQLRTSAVHRFFSYYRSACFSHLNMYVNQKNKDIYNPCR